MNQDQKQRTSSIDRANDFVNSTRSVYRKGKQAKKFLQAVRLTRTLAAASQGLGLGSVITIILASLFLATFLLSFLGGGAVSGTGDDQGDEPNVYDLIPGLAIDPITPLEVPNPNDKYYLVAITGNFDESKGEGKTLADLKMTLTLPDSISILSSSLQGTYTTNLNSDGSTDFVWDLGLTENQDAYFKQADGSDPPKWNFVFKFQFTPIKSDTNASPDFTIDEK